MDRIHDIPLLAKYGVSTPAINLPCSRLSLSSYYFLRLLCQDDNKLGYTLFWVQIGWALEGAWMLVDSPADNRAIDILLLSRRFRCTNSVCHRRVFAEPFPQLVGSMLVGRKSWRLYRCPLGARGRRSAVTGPCVPVSPHTILRLL